MDRPKTWLVANSASGSNDANALAAVEAALRPDHVVRLPDEDLPDAAALAGVGLLAIFAGDGTASRQASQLTRWTGQVLVLPGGTQNLLARRLHGDADAAAVLAGFTDGRLSPRRITALESRHGTALVEVIAGPGATWSDVREELRDRNVAGVATTLAEALRQSAAGPMVHVADPACGRADGYPALRLSPRAGGIAIAGYGADNAADYARQGVAILRRDFRNGPHDDLGFARRVVCRSEQPIELTLDGERVEGSAGEECFELADCGIEFLASGAFER